MSASPASVTRPALVRRPDRGYVGGVAAGIADHIGLSSTLVRLLFVGLAAAGGLGLALYGAYWIVVPAAPGVRPRIPPRAEIAVAVAAGAVAIAGLATSLPGGGLAVPTVLACLGGALIWRQASDDQRSRLRSLSQTSLRADITGRAGRVRLAVGAALVVAGAALVLARSSNFGALRDALPAIAVTLAGVALLTGPWWMRLAAQLSAERAERIRAQERADLAAQLHDSVLQTLALIQRNAESPKDVARLARGQERALRQLLYGPRSASHAETLAEGLRSAAADVEDAYGLRIDAVVVGDELTLGPAEDEHGVRLLALLAAAREAITNAARHSGAAQVSLYAEVDEDEIAVYVRDRGAGFDPDAVAPDRRGVQGSIIERMQRHGGAARVVTSPGHGTEVILTLPRR